MPYSSTPSMRGINILDYIFSQRTFCFVLLDSSAQIHICEQWEVLLRTSPKLYVLLAGELQDDAGSELPPACRFPLVRDTLAATTLPGHDTPLVRLGLGEKNSLVQ